MGEVDFKVSPLIFPEGASVQRKSNRSNSQISCLSFIKMGRKIKRDFSP